MRSGKENLRSFVAFSYIHDVNFESVIDIVMFARHLFVRGKDPFRVSDIYEQRFVAYSLYGSRHDFALTRDEVVKNHSALCFSDSLNDNLLSSLRRNSAEIPRSNLIFHHIADFVSRVDFHCLFQSNLSQVIFKIFI